MPRELIATAPRTPELHEYEGVKHSIAQQIRDDLWSAINGSLA